MSTKAKTALPADQGEKITPWEYYRSSLSRNAKQKLDGCRLGSLQPIVPLTAEHRDEDSSEYSDYVTRLSSRARQTLEKLKRGEQGQPADPLVCIPEAAAAYYIAESVNGEWLVTRRFKTPMALAQRLAQIEGSDVVAACFYGIVMPFSAGPQRLLLLPDGTSAVKIPVVPGLKPEIVPVDDILLAKLPMQTDGFLGPAALAQSIKLTADESKEKKYVHADIDEPDA